MSLLAKTRCALACGLVCGVLLFQSGGVLTYWRLGASWPAAAIPVHMILQVGPSWSGAAQNALSVWNGAGSRFRFSSRITSAPQPISCSNQTVDRRNVVVWSDMNCGEAWNPTTLAIARSWYYANGEYTDSDVIFNSNQEWSLYSGNLRPGPSDFRRVAIHEFGHVLGLAHPDDHGQSVNAIMNANVSNIDTIQADDIAGLIGIYGRTVRPTQPPTAPGRTTPPTLDLTCHGYDEGATRAYNCIPEPSQQHHMGTFVPAVGSACDGGRIAEFPPGRIVFQIRCRDGSQGQTTAWAYSGQGPASFVMPPGTPRVRVRTAFSGSSVHLSVWCRAPQQSLVVNELLGTSWGNDGTNGIYAMAGCREVEVDTGGQDLQWWFTQELAATALTPPRSWEQVTGVGGALPAEALQDLATAAELEGLWRRPGRWRMNPRRGANTRGALLTSDADGGTRLDLRIASTPDDRTYALDGAPFRGATRTVPLTLDLTCHGYDEGATRAYNCIPEPSQQHHMRTFVPAVGSACDGGRVAEFPPGRIVFQIRCRDGSPGQSAAWPYSGRGPASFVKPVDTPRVWVRTAFSGSSVHFVVRCRAPQQSLVVNELLGTSWGNDGTNGLYALAGCREVEVDTGGQDLQWWFTQELAATALTPPRSWGHVTGAGSTLPAEARRDLATPAELERLWPRPGR